MNDVKFGTSGLRGRVVDLTEPVVHAYVMAFLQLMYDQGHIDKETALSIGCDLRPSSSQIADCVARAAQHFGIAVENYGALPTPALALTAVSDRVPAIMITGSHIPADRNGLKFYSSAGEIDKNDETDILEYLGQIEPDFSDEKLLPAPKDTALKVYRARNINILPERALAGLKIGIYQHSCVGRDLLVDILSTLGAQIVPFGRSDQFISVDTEALDEQNRICTAQAAREHQLDAIISTDGDGDRPLIADSNGIYLRGDIIGLLTAQFLNADCVVTPVTSSSNIESCGLFKQVYRCRVGSPYVLAQMMQAKEQDFLTIVGFEANGGVILGNDVALQHGVILPALPTRDALLPILAVLGLAQRQNIPLHELVAQLPSRFTASDRLENIPTEKTTHFIDLLATDVECRQNFCQKFEPVHSQDQIDGLRLVLASGDSLHYRASGNAPELRCYSEASNLERAEFLVQEGLDYARSLLD